MLVDAFQRAICKLFAANRNVSSAASALKRSVRLRPDMLEARDCPAAYVTWTWNFFGTGIGQSNVGKNWLVNGRSPVAGPTFNGTEDLIFPKGTGTCSLDDTAAASTIDSINESSGYTQLITAEFGLQIAGTGNPSSTLYGSLTTGLNAHSTSSNSALNVQPKATLTLNGGTFGSFISCGNGAGRMAALNVYGTLNVDNTVSISSSSVQVLGGTLAVGSSGSNNTTLTIGTSEGGKLTDTSNTDFLNVGTSPTGFASTVTVSSANGWPTTLNVGNYVTVSGGSGSQISNVFVYQNSLLNVGSSAASGVATADPNYSSASILLASYGNLVLANGAPTVNASAGTYIGTTGSLIANVTGTATVSGSVYNVGNATLDAGTLELSNNYTTLGATTIFSGVLQFAGSAEQVGASALFQIFNGSTAEMLAANLPLGIRSGSIIGTGNIEGNLGLGYNPASAGWNSAISVTNATIAPGGGTSPQGVPYSPIGDLNITGNFTMFCGQMLIQIGGMNSYDEVNVGGTAQLGPVTFGSNVSSGGSVVGSLLSYAGGLNPSTSVAFLNAGRISSNFQTLSDGSTLQSPSSLPPNPTASQGTGMWVYSPSSTGDSFSLIPFAVVPLLNSSTPPGLSPNN